MKDVLDSELRRGDRILDANGDVFVVKDVRPDAMHIQNFKTGRRYTISPPKFLKMPVGVANVAVDLGTQNKRRNYYNKRVTGRRR